MLLGAQKALKLAGNLVAKNLHLFWEELPDSMSCMCALNCHGAYCMCVCVCQPGEPKLKAVEIISSGVGKR